jgi:uncharacterized membrane protein
MDVTPDNVYSGVYHSLVIGMTVATVLFSIGVVAAILRPGGQPLVVAGGSVPHWTGLVDSLLHFDPTAYMMLGVLVTILTPMTRVVVSLFAFLVDRDYTFVWITLAVVASAVASLLLGMFGITARA